ncbi:shikimate dehydrogenase family protein [Christiangramia crocea]|uniref:Shikimate dehydrogenase n=1 Tax=Christiangramia crocea TaxID=2904124 RepID=A0A9X1V1V1_9FLAO|nr:shikimate dehydrogenase [Gramella crocea]MCG9973123.1 shikimate dehydrogenase [Gramella crocea]
MRTFGLLGRNIDYSFSRKYFSEKFQKENIDAEYRNFDVDSIEKFPYVLRNNIISGLNVTIPYKEEIIPFLDHLDPHSREIQAVNTVKFEKDGSLCGYNTDYWGFLESLKPFLKPHHKKAIILGTGGASKAIAYALKLLEIDYQFVSRKKAAHIFSYKELNKEIFENHTLVINCTPLGTFPNTDNYPDVPVEYFSKNHLVFDLVYNPSETRLMQLAAEKGATTLNGLRMLELQAEKAWEIWNS